MSPRDLEARVAACDEQVAEIKAMLAEVARRIDEWLGDSTDLADIKATLNDVAQRINVWADGPAGVDTIDGPVAR